MTCGWSDAQAVAAVAGAWLWPAALAGWLWRRRGALAWLAATFGVFCAQTGVTFGIAFTVLGYGPRVRHPDHPSPGSSA